VNADNLAIELYPNPSSNVITLKSDKVISSVTIVDQLGRTVLVKTAEGSNAQITINKLNAGVYFAKVTFANQTNIATKRFVVE
ncbi:MAG: T9SS type A sorting domain-containing protein, partial [Chitinophagales bacterium]|nr:T9SS type A sorting domain-containing protein [Chitinophagales bacterium]